MALYIADRYWEHCKSKAEHERPRITEAAEHVLKELKRVLATDEYRKEIEGNGYEIPNDIQTIKGWLRPKAPSWAQKRGRPKKTDEK